MESRERRSDRGAAQLSRYRHLARAAWRQLWRHQARSVLVMTCAALGVTGSIAAVNFAAGGRQQVVDQVARLGSNVIVVAALQDRSTGGRARTGTIATTLRDDDYRAIRREVPAVVRSSALATASLRLKAGGLSKVAPVVGCEPAFFDIKHWTIDAGRPFDAVDLRRSARVALLGATVARDLFGDASPVGERLHINRVPFEVIGVLAERGQGLDVTNEDAQVYVPLTAAMRRLLNVEHYSALVLEVGTFEALPGAVRDVTDLLRDRHRTGGFRPDDFSVLNQQALADTRLAASRQLGFFVRWIGLSALLVAGVGVLAMAWITVRDRTREIGTRRALGATARDVFCQFAFEAMVLATAGAACGVALGWVASRIVAARAALPFVFDIGNAALAFALAIAVNFAFVSWPARRAARLDPIEALRHA
ncbi:MAG: ABC transporter permease [Steroidobacteraceae bacterium]|nr:ABC transporter permease [Steroidobacteraceae bacterium]